MIATTSSSAANSVSQISTLATHAASSVWSIGGEYFVILVLLAIFFVFAWYIGHGPFVSLLLSFYAGYAVYSVFPFMSSLPSSPALTAFGAHVGLYVVLVFIFFLILRRVIVSDFMHISLLGLAILALTGAGFLIALGVHSFDLVSFYHLTPSISALFPAKYFFYWFSAPAVGLFIFAR